MQFLSGKKIPIQNSGCKTFDKDFIPSEKYGADGAAAMKQIADMTARCWWMFLEGSGKNVLDNPILGGKKCFICYMFQLKKGISFDSGAFEQQMGSIPYKIVDSSDQCSSTGGGFCEQTCSLGRTKSPSNLCLKRGKTGSCCVAASECESKGGTCATPSQDTRLESSWSGCNFNTRCYVGPKSSFTYLDYIQKFAGAGRFFVDTPVKNIASGEIYAVVFTEDIKNILNIDVGGSDIDAIAVMRLSDVTNKCQLQEGVRYD